MVTRRGHIWGLGRHFHSYGQMFHFFLSGPWQHCCRGGLISHTSQFVQFPLDVHVASLYFSYIIYSHSRHTVSSVTPPTSPQRLINWNSFTLPLFDVTTERKHFKMLRFYKMFYNYWDSTVQQTPCPVILRLCLYYMCSRNFCFIYCAKVQPWRWILIMFLNVNVLNIFSCHILWSIIMLVQSY